MLNVRGQWIGGGGGGKVRVEGERRGSLSMVTSVALRGFVGVAKVRRERRLRGEGNVRTVLVVCLRRPAALGRPLVSILSKAGLHGSVSI